MIEEENKRLFRIAVIAFGIIMITGIAFVIYNTIFSVTLNCIVAPSDAIITLNGKVISAGSRKVQPGSYIISASRDGFESQTQEVQIGRKAKKSVYFALFSNSPETANWYNEHPEDAKLLEGMGSWAYDSAAQSLSQYAILQYLPHESATYSLGYGDCSKSGGSSFCLTISAAFGYRNTAANHLARLEANIGKYDIAFLDYSNPFPAEELSVPTNLSYQKDESAAELGGKLQAELQEIMDITDKRIAQLPTSSGISAEVYQLKLLGSGEYCAVTIRVNEDGIISDFFDLYKLILYNDEGNWISLTNPSIVLTYRDNPVLPHTLIDRVNRL